MNSIEIHELKFKNTKMHIKYSTDLTNCKELYGTEAGKIFALLTTKTCYGVLKIIVDICRI